MPGAAGLGAWCRAEKEGDVPSSPSEPRGFNSRAAPAGTPPCTLLGTPRSSLLSLAHT